MYSSMALAACLPAPMARMTVAAPVTASPPAYTALRVVRPSSPLVMMQPWLFVSRPGVVLRMRLWFYIFRVHIKYAEYVVVSHRHTF